MDFLICSLGCVDPSNEALFFGLLLFNNFLALLKEVLEVFNDAHHANVESVDPCLDSLLVGACRLLGHLFCGHCDFLLVHLNLCQSVLNLDVELRNLVFF